MCRRATTEHLTLHPHTVHPAPHPHTLYWDCINTRTHTHTHTFPPLVVCECECEWVGREEEVSCPYLDLHLDLQVSPVDGEQCAVRAGGAQLPGAVGHVPVAVSQEDQWGEGGGLAGEGDLLCTSHHIEAHQCTVFLQLQLLSLLHKVSRVLDERRRLGC